MIFIKSMLELSDLTGGEERVEVETELESILLGPGLEQS